MHCCLMAATAWHGSYTCHKTQRQDVINVMNLLTWRMGNFHWEFTLGSGRVHIVADLPFAALGQNTDAEMGRTRRGLCPLPVYETGGVKNRSYRAGVSLFADRQSRLDVPEYSFGIRDQQPENGRRGARPGAK
jgi:sulfur-oxidizing protein SoxB